MREDLAHASLLAQEAQRTGAGSASPALWPPRLPATSEPRPPAGRNAATAMGGVPSSETRENPFILGLQEHVLHAHRASSPLRVL